MTSLLIVGAGVFGLSTALAASESKKVSHITVIDDGFPHAASRGLGRIFRFQYPRTEYADLARAAKPLWETPPYNEFFHPTTKVIIQADGSSQDDEDAAWVEADKVLKKMAGQASKNGVKFVPGTVSSLQWANSRCIGAVTVDGNEFRADQTLLALGAGLSDFLAREGIRVGREGQFAIDDFCTPVALPWLCLKLDGSTYEQLKGRRITVMPGKGEYLPPNNEQKVLVNNARSAKVANITAVREDPRNTSSPFFQETRELLNELLPELRQIADERFNLYYCLDSMTLTQDFLVGSVPCSEALFMAGGGSCHAFKFLPNIGIEVLATIHGEGKYNNLWSYESHIRGGAVQVHQEVMPERDFPQRDSTTIQD